MHSEPANRRHKGRPSVPVLAALTVDDSQLMSAPVLRDEVRNGYRAGTADPCAKTVGSFSFSLTSITTVFAPGERAQPPGPGMGTAATDVPRSDGR